MDPKGSVKMTLKKIWGNPLYRFLILSVSGFTTGWLLGGLVK
jgi:hypothetical protein